MLFALASTTSMGCSSCQKTNEVQTKLVEVPTPCLGKDDAPPAPKAFKEFVPPPAGCGFNVVACMDAEQAEAVTANLRAFYSYSQMVWAKCHKDGP